MIHCLVRVKVAEAKAEAETKTKEDKDVGGGEKGKESIAKQMTGQVCCRKRMSGRQPTLYSLYQTSQTHCSSGRGAKFPVIIQ